MFFPLRNRFLDPCSPRTASAAMVVAAACVVGIGAQAGDPATRLNVVILYADDMG